MPWKSRSWLLIALILNTALAGCGDSHPPIVPVSGRVLIDDKPLKRGFVRFVPSNSRASTGKLDSDGRFTLTCLKTGDGAVVGEHAVEIVASEVLSATTIKWHTPKKYAQANTSGLSYQVSQPTNEAVFEISWEGGKPFVETLGSGEPSTEAHNPIKPSY